MLLFFQDQPSTHVYRVTLMNICLKPELVLENCMLAKKAPLLFKTATSKTSFEMSIPTNEVNFMPIILNGACSKRRLSGLIRQLGTHT